MLHVTPEHQNTVSALLKILVYGRNVHITRSVREHPRDDNLSVTDCPDIRQHIP
jgi:hypothetical protein